MFGTINCSFYALVGMDLIFLVWCLCALPWAQFLCWETASNPRIISQWLTVPPYTTFMSTLYHFLYLRFNFIYDQHLMLRVYTITYHPRRSSTEWSLNHIASYLGSLLISSMKPTFSWALLCTGSLFLSSLWSQGGRPRSTTTDYLPFTCHIFNQLLLNLWKYKTCSLVRESKLLRDWLYLWQKVSGLSSHCPPFFLFSEEETNNSRDFWGVVKKGSRKFCLMLHVPLSLCTLPLKNVVTSKHLLSLSSSLVLPVHSLHWSLSVLLLCQILGRQKAKGSSSLLWLPSCSVRTDIPRVSWLTLPFFRRDILVLHIILSRLQD